MIIINNTLLSIEESDVIDGVFIAPDEVWYIGNEFKCNTVVKMVLPNVVEIGYDFLFSNNTLEHLEMPKVEKIGDCFLYLNIIIINLEMPKVESLGECFLYYNTKFNYTPGIIKALKGDMLIGGRRVNKVEYLRKLNINKLLC